MKNNQTIVEQINERNIANSVFQRILKFTPLRYDILSVLLSFLDRNHSSEIHISFWKLEGTMQPLSLTGNPEYGYRKIASRS